MTKEIKPFLNTVTVTGADDSIPPQALIPIAERFPFVEFGILLSNRMSLAEGTSRFPSKNWLMQLASIAQVAPLRCSGHICGNWVHDAFRGRWPLNCGLHLLPWYKMFGAFQLNTHAEMHELDSEAMGMMLTGLLGLWPGHIIFQLDGQSGNKAAMEYKLRMPRIAGLFDMSHGTGNLPEGWPAPINGLACGYAGGLSPENVAEQLYKLQDLVGGLAWIDAETSLRGEKSNGFDLDRVKKFLTAAEPWVVKAS